MTTSPKGVTNRTEAQEAVLKAGVDSEIRYQMAKAMKEIARDVEYAYLNNSTNNAGDATTAPQMGGLQYFNTTNAVAMGSTPFSEDSLNDAIQLAWADGGSPKTVILSGANKRIASGFTAGSMKTRDVGSKKLVNVVDAYESDFGVVDLISHRMASDARIDILEDQYWKTAVFKPFTTYDLPKTSLKIEKVIVGYLTLECRAKDANASITGIVN